MMPVPIKDRGYTMAYTCDKCGALAEDIEGWLIIQILPARVVVLCPSCGASVVL